MMRPNAGHVFRLLVITVAAHAAGHAELLGQGLSASDVERVRSEVTTTMETYYALFSERNMEALPDEVFAIPWMTLGANGINASTSREGALVRWQGSLIDLLGRGWDRSVFTIESVCVLNLGAAIVSGYNTRYDGEGGVMSVGSVSYILGDTDEGWRIVAYTGHERGKVVSC
ncbi:MAG TPA: hypothetical protein VLA09_00750 [Longimicrobiales bacterium]|nr:hypothetical protein [Longimicrobiales bacterium]